MKLNKSLGYVGISPDRGEDIMITTGAGHPFITKAGALRKTQCMNNIEVIEVMMVEVPKIPVQIIKTK
jgi:DUF917 family protein